MSGVMGLLQIFFLQIRRIFGGRGIFIKMLCCIAMLFANLQLFTLVSATKNPESSKTATLNVPSHLRSFDFEMGQIGSADNSLKTIRLRDGFYSPDGSEGSSMEIHTLAFYETRLRIANTGITWKEYRDEVVAWEQSNIRRRKSKSNADKIPQPVGKRRGILRRHNSVDSKKNESPIRNSDPLEKMQAEAKSEPIDQDSLRFSSTFPSNTADPLALESNKRTLLSATQPPRSPHPREGLDDEFNTFVRICNILVPVNVPEAEDAILHKRRHLLKLSTFETIMTIAVSVEASWKVIDLIERNLFAFIDDFDLPLPVGQSIFTFEDPAWVILEHVYFVLFKIIETCSHPGASHMYEIVEKRNLHLRMFDLMKSPDQRERKTATKILTQFYTHHESLRVPILRRLLISLTEALERSHDLVEKRPIDAQLFFYTFILKRMPTEVFELSLVMQIFDRAILPIFKLPIFFDYYPSWKNIFLLYMHVIVNASPSQKSKIHKYLLKNALLHRFSNQFSEKVRIEFLFSLFCQKSMNDAEMFKLFNLILTYARKRARPRMAILIAEIMRDDEIFNKFYYDRIMFQQTKGYLETIKMICEHLLEWYIELDRESEDFKSIIQPELFNVILLWRSKIDLLTKPALGSELGIGRLQKLWFEFVKRQTTNAKAKAKQSNQTPKSSNLLFDQLQYAGKTPEQVVMLANARLRTLSQLKGTGDSGIGQRGGEGKGGIGGADDDVSTKVASGSDFDESMVDSIVEFRPARLSLRHTQVNRPYSPPLYQSTIPSSLPKTSSPDARRTSSSSSSRSSEGDEVEKLVFLFNTKL